MRLGAHVSSSGNLADSIEAAKLIGAETAQIFTSNPKGWSFRIRSQEEIEEFKRAKKQSNISPVFGHMIYLVNLASANPYIFTNSVNSLISGLVLAENAGLKGVVTHIGAHGGRGLSEGLKTVTQALSQVIETTKGKVPILLETDSGAGSHLGSSFEEIAYIIKTLRHNSIKVCLDTCHSFAASYDIRTNEGLEETLANFDKLIGLDKLMLVHLNDSKGAIGSKLDRHELIGMGEIGLEAFRNIVNHKTLKYLPGIVETPDNKATVSVEKHSLDALKELRKSNG